ncbi:hypothetical protein [Agaribacter marinus]|uniref:Lipoprotein n=1 Tax=Agaribacter marinus TaxID=1431249 RepID=A0AA37SZJ6_9ALTE|nr:hypothetical protein [Agaribacter marinus]GLR70890.1 hypothetical protein GCM10007852_17980 [Agaribacter marinus]
MKFLVLLVAAMVVGCANSQLSLQEKSNVEATVSYPFDFSQDQIVNIEKQQYQVVRVYFSAGGKKCAIVTRIDNQIEQSKVCFFKEKLTLLPRSLVNEVSQ